MKGQNLLNAGFLFLMLSALLMGCSDNNDQEARDQEIKLLQKYLEDNNITEEPTESGLYYIPISEGTGNQVGLYYIVDFEYVVELLDGTVLFTSYEDVAISHNVYRDDVMYGPIRLKAGNTGVPGLDEGLLLMKEGEKAKLIMPSNINGFGASSTALSPPYSTHIYTVDMLHAFDDPETFEIGQINDYLVEHQIDSVYTTPSGLIYIEEVAGVGDLIKDGDEVSVWYTGTYLDGRVFDSNLDGQAMIIQMPAVTAAGYIPAWDEALKLMREGTQAKIIIPYDLAYGEDGWGSIPPYMTLVFDMEIKDVISYE